MRKSREKTRVKNKTVNINCSGRKCGGALSAIYGLGFIGAVVYYISTASGFLAGFLGVLKALVWPAFLVFEMLKFLGA